MYLFDLKSQINKVRSPCPGKLEKNGIFKNSAELTEKQLCAGVSFTVMVQAAWINQTSGFTI